MLNSIWQIVLELAPWLLLGTLVAGILHVALPKRLLRGHLQGRWGVVKAVLIGVPMPLCSCGVIPAALGLRRDGASRGASLGFLISTPQTGVDSILVSASFLGWPFALFKVGAAAITGVLGGWLADAVAEPDAPEPAADAETLAAARPWPRELLAHSLDILASIWHWLVLGVVVSAAIDVWVPDSWLQGLGGLGSIGAGLAALAVSLPLYVCATASVPIAAALVAGGMPAGAALVFLMAGPATNVATIGAVARGFGLRTVAVYLGTIIAGSLAGAWLFDTLLSAGGGMAAHAHHGAGPVAVTSAILLLLLLAWFALSDLGAFVRRHRGATADAPALAVEIEGMHCNGCVKKVESALGRLDGVQSVRVTLEPGTAEVRGAVALEGVRTAVEAVGFHVVERADQPGAAQPV